MAYTWEDITNADIKALKAKYLKDYVYFRFLAKTTTGEKFENLEEITGHGKHRLYMVASDGWENIVPPATKVDLTHANKNDFKAVRMSIRDLIGRADAFGISLMLVRVMDDGEIRTLSRYDAFTSQEYTNPLSAFSEDILSKIIGVDARLVFTNIKQKECAPKDVYGKYEADYISSFKDCKKFYKVNGYLTFWTFVKDQAEFLRCSRGGANSIYILHSPNYDTVITDYVDKTQKRRYGWWDETRGMWAMSMVAVVLNEKGKLLRAINRFGEELLGSNMLDGETEINSKELSLILAMPYTRALENRSAVPDALYDIERTCETGIDSDHIGIIPSDSDPADNFHIRPIGIKRLPIMDPGKALAKSIKRPYCENWFDFTSRRVLVKDAYFDRCGEFKDTVDPSGHAIRVAIARKNNLYCAYDDEGSCIAKGYQHLSDFNRYGLCRATKRYAEYKFDVYNFIDTDGVYLCDEWFADVINKNSFQYGPYTMVYRISGMRPYGTGKYGTRYDTMEDFIDINGNFLLGVLEHQDLYQKYCASNINAPAFEGYVALRRAATGNNKRPTIYYEYNVFNVKAGKLLCGAWFLLEDPRCWDMCIFDTGLPTPKIKAFFVEPGTLAMIPARIDRDGNVTDGSGNALDITKF